MSDDIKTIAPEAEAIEALQRLQEHGIGRLPVVDGQGEFVGLVSRTDLMTAFEILQTRNRDDDTRHVQPTELR